MNEEELKVQKQIEELEQQTENMTEEEYFRKNYADYCYGDKLLSPYWDLFQDGVEFGERQSENKIADLEKENAVLERRIERAKECMKKLLFIINSDPANYNCKGLVQDAEDFIYNRTCNIRKSGNHCITNEPCIMCDK